MNIEVSFIISIVSICCVVATLVHNFSKDSKAEHRVAEDAMDAIKESLLKANLKLDQVCSTTNETRADIKGMDKRLIATENRVSVIERDLKTAFEKIDEIKNEK